MVDIVLVLRYEASVCFWVEARSVFAQIVIASWNQSYVQVICEHVQFLRVFKNRKNIHMKSFSFLVSFGILCEN